MLQIVDATFSQKFNYPLMRFGLWDNCQSVIESFNQFINQSISRVIEWQSVMRSVSRLGSPSVSHKVVMYSFNQSVNQSVMRSVSQSVSRLDSPSVSHKVSPSVSYEDNHIDS